MKLSIKQMQLLELPNYRSMRIKLRSLRKFKENLRLIYDTLNQGLLEPQAASQAKASLDGFIRGIR